MLFMLAHTLDCLLCLNRYNNIVSHIRVSVLRDFGR